MAFAFSGTTLAGLTITVSGTETSLTNLAALLNGITAAARSTAYTTGTIKSSGTGNGFWYLCTTGGTTSSTAPTWGTTEAGTTTDGTVVWTAFAQGYVLDTGLKKYCNISRCLFRFAASASLSYDAELWCIVGNTNVAATSAQVIVPNTATLTVGSLTAASQDAAWYRNVQTDGLILPKDNASSAGSPVLQVDAGGTLNLYGATITSRSVITLSGTFKSRNGVINRPTGGTGWRVNFGSTTVLDIIGLYAPSVRWCTQLGMTVTNLSGFRGFDNLQWDVNVLGSTASSFFTIRDQPYNGFPSGATGVYDIANRNGFCWRFLNAEKGDGLNVCAYTSTTEGVTEVAQEVTVKFRTAAGGAVDTPIWFARGYNNGKRRDYTSSPRPSGTQYATQGDDTYVVSGNSSGDCAATALLNFVCVSNLGDANNTTSNTTPAFYDIRCDGGTRGSNIRTIYYKRYGSLPQTLKAAMLGVGGTTISAIDAADTSVTMSKAAALALIGSSVSINTGTNTVTVLASCTLDDLHDACKAWGSEAVLAQLEFPTSATLPVSSSGTILSTDMNVVVNLGATLSSGSKHTGLVTSGTITINGSMAVAKYTSSAGTFVQLSVASLTAGSRIQLYNVTDASEMYNAVVAGTSYSSYVQYTADKTIRLRATYCAAATAKLGYEATGTLTINGLAFTAAQVTDGVYVTYGVDGSSVTGVAADYVQTDIDITVAANFYLMNLYAWWAYNLTTIDGIRYFFGGLTAVDEGNLQVNTAIVDAKLDNATSTDIWALDNRRFFRDDGARPVRNPTTGGGGIDVEWREKVLFVNSADITSIKATVEALPSAAQNADAVWDETLTGATHNITTSAGRRLRQITSSIILDGIAQGPGTGNNQIQLASDASAMNGAYDPSIIYIASGTGAGQSRIVLQYNGATKTATVHRGWRVAPDNTSEYIIQAHADIVSVNEGLAQAGGANTITLNSDASSVDGTYVGQLVFLVSGTGEDQCGMVSAYNGTTKVATVEVGNGGGWRTIPDTTTAYVMMPASPVLMASADVSAEKIAELHALKGLDATRPLTVTPASMVAGSITVALGGDGTTITTATRAP